MSEKEIINYLRSYKYDILIVFFIIIICFCLVNIYYNFEDNDNMDIYKNMDITFESIRYNRAVKKSESRTKLLRRRPFSGMPF